MVVYLLIGRGMKIAELMIPLNVILLMLFKGENETRPLSETYSTPFRLHHLYRQLSSNDWLVAV